MIPKVGDVFYVLTVTENEYFGEHVAIAPPITLQIVADYDSETWRVQVGDGPHFGYFNKSRIKDDKFVFTTLEEAWKVLEREVQDNLTCLLSQAESYRSSINDLLKRKNDV